MKNPQSASRAPRQVECELPNLIGTLKVVFLRGPRNCEGPKFEARVSGRFRSVVSLVWNIGVLAIGRAAECTASPAVRSAGRRSQFAGGKGSFPGVQERFRHRIGTGTGTAKVKGRCSRGHLLGGGAFVPAHPSGCKTNTANGGSVNAADQP